MADSSANKISVESLAEDYISRLRKGERPEIEDYIGRYPDLADEIREFFPTLELVEEFKPGSSEDAVVENPILGDLAHPEKLGDFVILREVGRGGMGVVYEARQQSLGRTVALKVLPPQSLPDAQQQRRFVREARSAARLHHTNIVPVFGVGEQDGLNYFAIQFINGLGLDQVLDELRQMQPRSGKSLTEKEKRPQADPPVWDCAEKIVTSSMASMLLTGSFQKHDLTPLRIACGPSTDEDSRDSISIEGGKDSAEKPQ